MLKVVEFIRGNDDWEELLSNAPYFIKISKDSVYGRNLIGFKYNQIDSDFSDPMVRECRGLILDENTFEPVSVPFFKFGNYGESYCPNIDWSSAKVEEKIDGSLVKIVRIGDEILISTNGTIDASKAEVVQGFACPYKNYRELVLGAEPFVNMDYKDIVNLFDNDITYMFELTSPYNKVVIPYEGIRLNFIGMRDNKTLQEDFVYGHRLSKLFNVPKTYDLKTLDDCIASAKVLPYNEEGYVVCDRYFNRVKVKSAAYVAVHHLKGEGILTPRKALELLKLNEVSEYLTYFNEYRANFEELGRQYEALIQAIDNDWNNHADAINGFENRKDKALYIKANCKYCSYAFAMISGKYHNAREYVGDLNVDKALEMMEANHE